MRRTVLLAAAVVLGAGCSTSSGSPAGTTVPATAATLATFAPTTTSTSSATTTTLPTTTLLTTTVPSTTTLAPTTTSTSTTPTTTSTSTTATATAPPAGFVTVAGPAVPDRTDPIDPAWVDPATQELLNVDDGTYWATATGQGTADGGAQFVTFKLVQAFFGSACTARFGADSCDNDIGTLETPSGTMPMFLGAAAVTVADPTTQESYAISAQQLFSLVADPTNAPGAPAGYVYVPFAYLLHVAGGQIVTADQVWSP